MPDRRNRTAATIDLVALAPHDGTLAVLLRRSRGPSRERWELPWSPLAAGTLDAQAERAARAALGGAPGWLRQVGAFDGGHRHPGDVPLSVAFAALVSADDAASVEDHEWHSLEELPALAPRQRQMVDAAAALVRDRVDREPVAFRLLPSVFTLSELQQMYELLLGRRLHKASFRRALQGAHLVQPTDAWRTEGRGRPAQLFRFAPRRRRGTPRGVRLDIA